MVKDEVSVCRVQAAYLLSEEKERQPDLWQRHLRSFRYISGRRGMHNWAVEHNVAAFSELSFAIRRQGMLPRG